MTYREVAKVLAGLSILGLVIKLLRSRRSTKTNPPGRYPVVDRIPQRSLAHDEDPSDVIEALTLPVLRQRVSDVYREGYLTVLAIIQGVALGLLLSTTQQEWLHYSTLAYRIMIATESTGVFIAIIIVTHRYILLTVIGRWVPTVFDTLIPYALGVGEIGGALMIARNAAWWGSVCIFSIAGASSFAHSRIRMPAATFGDIHQLRERFLQITLRAIIILSLLIPISITIAILGVYSIGSCKPGTPAR